MLDVAILRNPDNTHSFDVYRKPTHTNHIPFDSHQPHSHKLSTIHALTRRASLIPSTDELKKAEMERVKEALTLNGYPKWAFDRAWYRPPPPLPSDDNPPSLVTSSSSSKTRLGNVSLPYFVGVRAPNEGLQRQRHQYLH